MDKTPKKIEDVKKEIRSLLLSSPVGLSLQDLLSDYRSMIGCHLPFQQLGYSSALDFIKDIPDVVYPVFRAGGVMYLEAVADSTTVHIKKLVLQQKRSGKVRSIRKTPDESVRRPPPKSIVPALVRMKIKELLRSSPEGIEASMFGTAFKNRFAVEIDFQKLGFPSLKRLLQECSDCIRIVKKNINGVNSEILFPGQRKDSSNSLIDMKDIPPRRQRSALESKSKSLEKPLAKSDTSKLNCGKQKKPGNALTKDMKSLMDLEPEIGPQNIKNSRSMLRKQSGITAQSGVSDQLKMEIKNLLEGKKNGMWLARLPFEYKRCYKKELDMAGAGYYSLITMMGSIPDIVKIERPVNNGDWLLIPAVEVKEIGEEDPLPPDAVKYDGIYQKLSHPTEGQIEIFIVQINSPDCFYFHWCKQKASLDKLMSEMSDFYKTVSSQNYMLPASHRKTGQVCCAVYEEDGEWYRAMIVHALSDSEEVEVIFTDYGDKATVRSTNLRLLRKDFLELPAMGLKGSLANIKPLNSNTWAQEASTRFFELSKDKVLLGKIHNYGDGILSLNLADTNFNRTVHINDVLVVENFACYDKIQREPPMHLHLNGMGQASQAAKPVSPLMPNPISPLLQTTPFANNAASFQALQQQIALMNSMQLTNMLYSSMQQRQQVFPAQAIQQAVMNQQQRLMQMSRLPATLPATYQPQHFVYNPVTSGVAAFQMPEQEQPRELKKTSSIDSLIECINSELDGKTSSDEETNEQVLGNNGTEPREAEEQAAVRLENETAEESADEERRPTDMLQIKSIQVPEPYQLHILNYKGKPYVTRGEVAALLWHKDILRQMLRQQKVAVTSIVITREDNESLFESLEIEKVKDMVSDGEVKEFLTIYELESLPKILDVFKHKSEVLKTVIKDEISCYKNSPADFWETDESIVSESEDVESDSLTLELELEELRLLLQAMQFRRKRLVNALMSKAPPLDAVNELRRVEEEVEKIRKTVQMKESSIKC